MVGGLGHLLPDSNFFSFFNKKIDQFFSDIHVNINTVYPLSVVSYNNGSMRNLKFHIIGRKDVVCLWNGECVVLSWQRGHDEALFSS